MNVLVACEESQRVTSAFRARGQNAFSCDLKFTSGDHPEWHIQGDVLEVLNPICSQISFKTCDGKNHLIPGAWDMVIAFPPCTDLAVSGARHFAKKRLDGSQQRSIDFFLKFVNADCEKICIENPIGIMSTVYRKPDQIIQPWQFAFSELEFVQKSTCLWLKGLPKLEPIRFYKPDLDFFEWVDKSGVHKRQSKFIYDTRKKKSDERGCLASKTFFGIAFAMADAWSV